MAKFSAWFNVVIVFSIAGIASSAHFSAPTSCDNQETWFSHGHTYSYKYNVDTHSGVFLLDQMSHGHHVTCDVRLDVPNKCEMVLSTDNCIVRTSLSEIDLAKSAQLKLMMGQHPVYFKYNRGEVVDNELFTHRMDPMSIQNLKRGILSLMQLKIFPTKEQYELPTHNRDVLGSCVTHTQLVSGHGHQMETYKDLALCNHTDPGQYKDSDFYRIKRNQKNFFGDVLTQLINPMDSSVTCEYKITPDLSMKEAKCLQRHSYSPLLFNGRVATNISQTLELISKDTLPLGVFQRDLSEYEVIALAMDIGRHGDNHHDDDDDDDAAGVKDDDLDKSLDKCVMDIISDDVEDVTPAKQFSALVSQLRNTQEKTIRTVKSRVFSCQSNEDCFQFSAPEITPQVAQMHFVSAPRGVELVFDCHEPWLHENLKKKCLVSGLTSCGSESCLMVLAEMFKDSHISRLDILQILFDMAMVYRPHVRVMENIHDYCLSNARNSECWFSLSAMLNRLEIKDNDEGQQGRLLLARVVVSLKSLIGTKCQQQSMRMNRAHKEMREHSILTALKALSNIGRLLTTYQGKKELSGTLMDCVMNNQHDVVISHNALKALTKMGFLEGPSDQLMKILQDDNGEMALRAAVFDIFVVQERKELLRPLLSLLETTKLDTMKTYIATRVSSILESPDPSLIRLQKLLQELLTDKTMPEVKKILSKSHYAEMSHYFMLPLTPFNLGASIGVSVILNPASNFFQTFTVKTGLIVNGKSVEAFEMTFYLEGLDSLMDLIQDLKEHPTKLIQKEDFFKMLHAYMEGMAKGKIPSFKYLDNKLVKRFTEIFTAANMKKATAPRLLATLKVLDYDVTFLSSNSVLKRFENSKQYLGKGLIRTLLKNYHTFLVSASKLTDFQQTIPSIAGLPIEFGLDSTFVTRTALKSQGELEHKTKWSKVFTFDWSLEPSFSISHQSKVATGLAGYFDTEVRHQTWINGIASLTPRVKTSPQLFQKDPLFSIGITKTVGHKAVKFLNARSDTFLLVNGERKPSVRQESSKRQFDKCLPTIYTKVLGHKICIRGSQSLTQTENKLSTAPLLAPSTITGVIIPTDKKLKLLSFDGYYETTWTSAPGYRVHGKFEGKGSELSRSVLFSLQRKNNMPHQSPNYDCQIILEDANLVVSAHVLAKKMGYTLSKEMAVSVTNNEITSHSMSFSTWKTIDWRTNIERESMIKANITMTGGELSLAFSRRKTNNSLTTRTDFTEFKYHCKPSLPLLYSLHPNPAIASKSGHTSTFSLLAEVESSGTSLKDIWRGTYTDELSAPGHHISHTSKFVADLSGANRTTNITWSVGRKQHIYRMDGHVKNKTRPGRSNYDYKMSVVKTDAYVMGVEGHVKWSLKGGLTLSGEIDYKSLHSNSNTSKETLRKKRSLSAILNKLRRGERKVEKLAVNTYAAAKKSFLALSKWNVSFDVAVSLKPDIVKTPLGVKVIGMGCHWNANVSALRDEKALFLTQGSIYRGRKFKLSGSVQDNIHHTAVVAKVEHENNNEFFYHYHKLDVVQKEHARSISNDQIPLLIGQGSRNFSSEVRVHLHHDVFHHLPHFELDVNLINSLANLTYHLNYTKMSAKSHVVRANASVTSDILPLYLQYKESSNLTDGKLESNFVMNSTFLDYDVTLIKTKGKKGIGMGGDFKYKIKLPYYRKESSVGVRINLGPKRPPVCRILYHPNNYQAGIQTTLTLLGPKRIQLLASAISDTSAPTQEPQHIFVWTVELTGLRVLQHTVNISEQGAKLIRGLLTNQLLRRNHVIGHNDQVIEQAPLLGSVPTIPHKSAIEILQGKLNETLAQSPHSSDVKLLQFMIGALRTGQRIWKKSIPGTIYYSLNLDEGFVHLKHLASKLVTELTRRSPFVLEQFTKIYVQPQLRAMLNGNGKQATAWTMSLPFVWESFMEFPHGTMVDRELLEEKRLSKVISPYRDVAVMADGRWVRTFDGRWLDIQGFSGQTCVHLMAGDLKKRRFAILYSMADGLTVLSKRNGVNLKLTGEISSLDGMPIRSLPFTASDEALTVTLTQGKLSLLLSNGLARLTLDTRQRLVLFEMTHQLNNASLGVWGTNNQEVGDDFRLSNGTISESPLSFLNSFELSQGQQCRSFTKSFSSDCNNYNNEADSICQNFFRKETELSTCALQIEPWPFQNLCQSEECHGRSGCTVVKTYADICRHRGLDVQLPTGCESCQKSMGGNPKSMGGNPKSMGGNPKPMGGNPKSMGGNPKPMGGNSKTDIVFVQPLISRMVDDNNEIMLDKIVEVFKGLPSSDVTLGIVTYAGNRLYKKPRARLINEKLLGRVHGNTALPSSLVRKTSGSSYENPEEAIRLAAAYPFREGSTRLIVLIHTAQVVEKLMDETSLANALSRRHIHFISAASRPHYAVRGIVGVTYSGETINGETIYTDSNNFNRLVKSTKGAWLSTDFLTAATTTTTNTHRDPLYTVLATISKNDNKCFWDV